MTASTAVEWKLWKFNEETKDFEDSRGEYQGHDLNTTSSVRRLRD